MADINNLVVFAENGEKDTTGLNQTNGFPAALKPARQWFNFLFNSLTSKMNEVITKVNSNSNTLDDITDYFLPIGTVISSFDPDFDPNAKYIGTTWVLHGQGRVAVGLSTQESDATWKKTIGNEFGSDEHALTVEEGPEHNHNDGEFKKLLIVNGNGTQNSSDATAGEPNLLAEGNKDILPSGEGQPHNNVQPSIVEARWRRTA